MKRGKQKKNAEFTKYRKLVRLQRKKSKAKNVRETQIVPHNDPSKFFIFTLFFFINCLSQNVGLLFTEKFCNSKQMITDVVNVILISFTDTSKYEKDLILSSIQATIIHIHVQIEQMVIIKFDGLVWDCNFGERQKKCLKNGLRKKNRKKEIVKKNRKK